MSIWRDIWKESIKANRIMAQDVEGGLAEFQRLFKKFGDDGMIHYALGESYEAHKNYTKALEEYNLAKNLFPVPHWKKVAQDTINRVSKHQSTEIYFETEIPDELLWYTFQKVYEFINLDDLVRYVCLSAIARASSEWPLSLVDFRTVLELLIKTEFPEIVEIVKTQNYGEFKLSNGISELAYQKIISKEIKDAMHAVRKEGNIAVHELRAISDDDITLIKDFVKILEYFNGI